MYQFYRIAYNTYTIIDSTFYSFILYIVYTFHWEKRREQKGVYVIADNIGMAEVSYIRNPYPLPDLYPREGVWTKKPVLGSKVSPNDLEWSRKLNVYERLFAHHTLTSIRKDCRLQRKEVIGNYSSKYISRDLFDLTIIRCLEEKFVQYLNERYRCRRTLWIWHSQPCTFIAKTRSCLNLISLCNRKR